MQLSYRGIKYNVSNPAVDITDANVEGHYRGATYRIRQANNASAKRTQGLIYRGAVVR